jgi:hypothetical protein
MASDPAQFVWLCHRGEQENQLRSNRETEDLYEGKKRANHRPSKERYPEVGHAEIFHRRMYHGIQTQRLAVLQRVDSRLHFVTEKVVVVCGSEDYTGRVPFQGHWKMDEVVDRAHVVDSWRISLDNNSMCVQKIVSQVHMVGKLVKSRRIRINRWFPMRGKDGETIGWTLTLRIHWSEVDSGRATCSNLIEWELFGSCNNAKGVM